ncbi:type VI secretion system transmembrane protein TssO [Myroides sp. WP-1]|uniref:type VI secretion system transmembrane protein TssO n=1 Tax=Myroides sp. WP-1 TaxID=2759944 RepID=UPI0015FC92B0|nr:type VI secretion system transmembrane protein TssO [Myroides sp. WP-1]MBB1139391.1 type VI secretion system transmembrane protein TssO [Myroides sp. WP-1]
MSQNKFQTLSRGEKMYQFLYLLGMLVLSQALLGVICLRNYRSPFSQSALLDSQLLEQNNKFNKQQKLVEPLVESAFHKINILNDTSPQPQVENDVITSINAVANSFANTAIYDPRKEAYMQISYFYQMFFEDKKIAAKKTENTLQFSKQFEECSIGFKDKEQQLNQRKNMQSPR